MTSLRSTDRHELTRKPWLFILFGQTQTSYGFVLTIYVGKGHTDDYYGIQKCMMIL